jgi:EAL domain-containing protein (putative c-di-GMP-specific phosphodiesterase class I)
VAIADREFDPYFQPQFNAHTGKISGVEVLARWPSKQLGLVTPDSFLPIARQLYMMGELDQLMFDKASDQIMTLHQKGIRIPKISFNVTAERVIGGGALKSIRSLGENRPQISIEVLESVIVEDQLDVFWIEIEKLRKLGVGIEIDDFGSGHTSLVGALELRPDVLKIDRRLITPITTSKQAKKMLEQIVGMAKIIGLKITAEGVETIEHAKIATDCGCDILQGFGLALPMPIAELETFLQNNANLLLSPGTTPHRWTKTSVCST